MAQHHGVLHDELSDRAMFPVMDLMSADRERSAEGFRWGASGGTHVASTDPCEFNVDQNVMGVFQLRDRSVLELDLVNPLEDERQILDMQPWSTSTVYE